MRCVAGQRSAGAWGGQPDSVEDNGADVSRRDLQQTVEHADCGVTVEISLTVQRHPVPGVVRPLQPNAVIDNERLAAQYHRVGFPLPVRIGDCYLLEASERCRQTRAKKTMNIWLQHSLQKRTNAIRYAECRVSPCWCVDI